MLQQPDLFQQPPQERLAEFHVRNQKLFSSHYLAYRLPDRALWGEMEDGARQTFERIKAAYRAMSAANLFEAKNEAETERVFIRPAFQALGFEHFSVQPSLDSYDAKRRPDYALFPDQENYETAQLERGDMKVYYGKAIAIGEAKYWNRPMNDRVQGDKKDPSDATKQIVGYLRDVAEWTDGKTNWGILTNGKLWRLFYRRADYTAENYLEIDLEAIIHEDNFEAFKYFYALLSHEAFVTQPVEGISWLESYLKGSADYSTGITKRLKELIFEKVFDGLVQGFVQYRREKLGITREEETSKRAIFQGCLTLLYRLLFLLNAESRLLLPMDNRSYRERSLRALMERIWKERGQRRTQHDFDYWNHLARLFNLINDGAPEFNLPRYNGGLFKRPDPNTPLDQLKEEEIGPWFLEKYELANLHLYDAIEQLTFDLEVPTPSVSAFIDYSSLGVRHLGEIYEGLLEFKVEIAEEEPVCAVGSKKKLQWKKRSEVTESDTVHFIKQIGEPYITNDKGERKATGSYYTPHYIVEYIVEHTIRPQLRRFRQEKAWFDQLQASEVDFQKLYQEITQDESEEGKARLQTLWELCKSDEGRGNFLLTYLDREWTRHNFDPATRALELKVLDPAMGSGHFLVHAVDSISECVALFLNEFPESPVGAELERLRKGILENVQNQGVRIDESKLNDVNLIKRMVMKRCVYGVDLNPMAVELAKLSLWLDSFTVGAPLSFLNHHLRCGNSLIGAIDVSEYLPPGSQREKQFKRAVADLLLVADLTDSTISEVEQSQRLYEEAQKQLEPTKRRVNVDVATYFINMNSRFLDQAIQYAYKDQGSLEPKNEVEKAHLQNYLRAQEISREKRFLHWELEFPEVWYTKRGRRINSGFDAVIGNPPYLIVSNYDVKSDTDYLKESYLVSRGYKVDLYMYFVERGLKIAKQRGWFSQIIPNKFTLTISGRKLRTLLAKLDVVELVNFGLEKVFEEALNYTCILTVRNDKPSGYLRYRKSDRTLDIEQEYDVPLDSLTEDGWALVPASSAKLNDRLDAVSDALNKITKNIFAGIQTGLDSVFVVERPPAREESLYRPFYRSKDIYRYSQNLDCEFVLYPYKHDGRILPETELKTFRVTYQRLKHHERNIRARQWFGQNAEQLSGKWYGLMYFPNPELFKGEKIICPYLATRASFTLDENEAIFGVGAGYGIYLKGDRIFHLYVLAVLNSKLLHFRFSQVSPRFQSGHKFNEAYISLLPIRRIFFTTPESQRKVQIEKLKKLYNEMLTHI